MAKLRLAENMRLLATFRLDTAENVLSEAEALALTDEFVINTVSVNIGIMRSLCIYDDWTISPILFVELRKCAREVCGGCGQPLRPPGSADRRVQPLPVRPFGLPLGEGDVGPPGFARFPPACPGSLPRRGMSSWPCALWCPPRTSSTWPGSAPGRRTRSH